MDKPRPLSLSAYAIALQNDFKGKWYSQYGTCSRGLNSNLKIPESRKKSLEGK